MKNPEESVGATILPPEAVEDDPPPPHEAGVIAPVLGMILAVVATWLVLTVLGVI